MVWVDPCVLPLTWPVLDTHSFEPQDHHQQPGKIDSVGKNNINQCQHQWDFWLNKYFIGKQDKKQMLVTQLTACQKHPTAKKMGRLLNTHFWGDFLKKNTYKYFHKLCPVCQHTFTCVIRGMFLLSFSSHVTHFCPTLDIPLSYQAHGLAKAIYYWIWITSIAHFSYIWKENCWNTMDYHETELFVCLKMVI